MTEDKAPAVQSRVRPRFLKVAAAAAILDMHEATLYRAIHAGEFPALKVRGRYVVPAKAIDQMEDAAVTSGSVIDSADWTDNRSAA